MKDKETLIAYALAAAGVTALIWLVPPVGLVAAFIALALIPPWGRGLIERAAISAIAVMGIVAIVFPRDSTVPITPESARGLLTALVVGAVAIRLIPSLRTVPLPRVGISDLAIIAAAVIGWIWLSSAYWGASSEQIISGLYFSGWDNQGHFLPFANTYEMQATAWTTIDGSIAWNQWYPALHSSIWALAEQALNGAGASRLELLWPYVSWTVLSFVASFAALAYVAGDLAARITRTHKSWARVLAIGAVAAFGLLGSPALLFNSGFTNFVMGIAVVATATYLSARSMKSARNLGWFLVPAAGLAALGLWTPLVLALVPTGIVVLAALWRAPEVEPTRRRVLAIAWAIGTAIVIGLVALDQSQAILGVDGDSTAEEFNQDIGRVSTGMIEFNTGLALAAPLIVIFAAILIRRRGLPLMLAIATPTLAVGAIAWIFSLGADANGVARLQNYYVLKSLDGMLLMVAPILAALAAAAIGRALASARLLSQVAATFVAALVALGTFGYVGTHPAQPWQTFTAAPGIQAGFVRASAVQGPIVGEGIVAGVEGANQAPDRTPLLWDGSGLLQNLWVRSLSGVLSKQEAEFYGGMPPFPYDQKAVEYISLALNLKPSLDLIVVYFRPPSGDLLNDGQATWPENRVELVQIPMKQSPLCAECPI